MGRRAAILYLAILNLVSRSKSQSDLLRSIVDDLAGFNGCHTLAFFLVGMDLETGVDACADGCGFHDIADGAGSEAVAANEHGNIRLSDNQAEANPVLANLGNAEFGLVRVLDELERDELEKVLNLIGGFLHNNRLSPS